MEWTDKRDVAFPPEWWGPNEDDDMINCDCWDPLYDDEAQATGHTLDCSIWSDDELQ